LHQNVSLRHKEPVQIVEEVRDLATRYDVTSIVFANMDIHDSNLRRFDDLLDRLVALRTEEGIDVVYSSDIAAARLNATTLKKMALAGFDNLLVGFEAMTDRLLEKVNKAHRFAHNICFLKLTDKFKIQHGANILMGVPDETREDVIESIQNLHYLRFYPPGTRGTLWIRPMFLGARAPYETAMSDTERNRWVIDDAYSVYGFLPGRIAAAGNRMHLGSFRAPLWHSDLWDEFQVLVEAYQKTRREYHWFSRGEEAVLQERGNGEIVKEFALEPGYCEVLRLANDRVVGFGELSQKINTSFPELPEAKLREIVCDLKSEYLLYADEKLRTIISVVDTDDCPHPVLV